MKKLIHHAYFIPWLIFIFFTTIYFSSTVGIMNSSDAPQYALTQALAEEHTTRIDNYSSLSWPDYAPIDGHLYSIRPPGFSIVAIPFYILAKWIQSYAFPPYLDHHPGITNTSSLESLTVVFPSLCGALIVMLVYLIGLHFTKNIQSSFISSITFGLGTLNWKYSSVFLRHSLYIFLLLLMLYLLLKFHGNYYKATLFLSGFILGYAYVTDQSAIFLIPLFIIAILGAIKKYYHTKKFYLSIILFLIGFTSSLSILLSYNLASYGKINRNLYQDIERRKWMNYSASFSTPLFPSLFINLFSKDPIPINAISPILRNNPILFIQESANWATIYPYKGIFIQSPYLFVAIIGFAFFFGKNTRWAVLILAICLAVLVPFSKYVEFYNETSYDTRFFLTLIPFLSVGLSFWWQKISFIRNKFTKYLLIFFTLILTLISIYYGWYSNLTNFAPHVTGEHRFYFYQLSQPYFTPENFLNNSWLLFINTFPNIYNIHLLFLFYFPLFFIIYILILKNHTILKNIHHQDVKKSLTSHKGQASSEKKILSL